MKITYETFLNDQQGVVLNIYHTFIYLRFHVQVYFVAPKPKLSILLRCPFFGIFFQSSVIGTLFLS